MVRCSVWVGTMTLRLSPIVRAIIDEWRFDADGRVVGDIPTRDSHRSVNVNRSVAVGEGIVPDLHVSRWDRSPDATGVAIGHLVVMEIDIIRPRIVPALRTSHRTVASVDLAIGDLDVMAPPRLRSLVVVTNVEAVAVLALPDTRVASEFQPQELQMVGTAHPEDARTTEVVVGEQPRRSRTVATIECKPTCRCGSVCVCKTEVESAHTSAAAVPDDCSPRRGTDRHGRCGSGDGDADSSCGVFTTGQLDDIDGWIIE